MMKSPGGNKQLPESIDYYASDEPEDTSTSNLLEVVLIMMSLLIITATFSSAPPDEAIQLSSQQASVGQGAEVDTIKVNVGADGYHMNGKKLTQEELTSYLESEEMSSPLLEIEADNAIHENLRWLLLKARDSHDIKIGL